jgi:branched-chain amino acid transport system ATP-binding protein
MNPPILELDGVGKTFGGIQALKQVSFTLQEGQIVALIGPNGAGKTTLVSVTTGVQRASEGRVFFRGRDVTRQRPFQAARCGLARTFQIVQPFPRRTSSRTWRRARFLQVRMQPERGDERRAGSSSQPDSLADRPAPPSPAGRSGLGARQEPRHATAPPDAHE